MASKMYVKICECGCGAEFQTPFPARKLKPECAEATYLKRGAKKQLERNRAARERDRLIQRANKTAPKPMVARQLQAIPVEKFARAFRKVVQQ